MLQISKEFSGQLTADGCLHHQLVTNRAVYVSDRAAVRLNTFSATTQLHLVLLSIERIVCILHKVLIP